MDPVAEIVPDEIRSPQVILFVPQETVPLEVMAPELKAPQVIALVPVENAPLEVIDPQVKLFVPQEKVPLEVIGPQAILLTPVLSDPQVKELLLQVKSPLEVIAPEVRELVPQDMVPIDKILKAWKAPQSIGLVPEEIGPKDATPPVLRLCVPAIEISPLAKRLPQVILRVPELIDPAVKEFVPQVNAPLEVIAPEVKLFVPEEIGTLVVKLVVSNFIRFVPPAVQACPAVPTVSQKYPELVEEEKLKGGAAALPFGNTKVVGSKLPPE